MSSADKLFKMLNDRLEKGLKYALEMERANAIAKGLGQTLDPEKYQVRQSRNKVEISKPPGKEQYGDKVIDMKPHFKASSKAKPTKTGGWYLVVPIRRYTGSKRRKQASGMSSKMYDELRKTSLGGASSRTVVSDYLYNNRFSGSIPELSYEPKSNNITKLQNTDRLKRRNSSSYVSFRTISDNSSPNSWLLNRESATEDNMRDETRQIIALAKKYYDDMADRQNR